MRRSTGLLVLLVFCGGCAGIRGERRGKIIESMVESINFLEPSVEDQQKAEQAERDREFFSAVGNQSVIKPVSEAGITNP